MSESEHLREMRRWLRYAQEDLYTAWESVCAGLARRGLDMEKG